MKNNPIRVGHVIGKMVGGGVEQVILNYYTHIDKEKIQFDFIIDDDSTDVPRALIEENGGRIFEVPGYQKVGRYQKALEKLFREQNYTIVHSHINALSVFPLQVAKKVGIPVRIAHNHSTAAKGEFKKNVMKYALRLFSKRYPTHFVAPTKYAGEWMFGKNVRLTILHNGIDVERFSYNETKRKATRHELGIDEETYLFGNAGRMVWQKNQTFVLEIFSEIQKREKNSKLLLIGNGPLEEELKVKAKELGVEENVIHIPNTTSIEDYFNAMDMFLFPSNYEGLGMVAVESQVVGLPVLTSYNVPEEVNMTQLYYPLSLKNGADKWANVALHALDDLERLKIPRRSHAKEIEEAGYSIQREASKLVEYYERIAKETI